MVVEKTLASPLDSKEIKPVNLKGNQPWRFIGRTDAEAEAPILWPPDVRKWLTEKDPDAGKDWRQKEKRATEDEMVGWHHQLNGHELGKTLRDGEGQGSLECYSWWGLEELDHKEDGASKNWCFWTVGLENTLKSALNCKGIKPVTLKGNQPWIFVGRIDAEAETPILWLLEVKSWLTEKDPDAGKDWRQKEKRVAEGEMIR